VKNTLSITETTFLQNAATYGGAIYLGNQALIADSSYFIENNALQGGGAFATMSSSNSFEYLILKSLGGQLVDLRQSSFTQNNASEGAALITLKEMNFIYSTSIFQGNTAVYGGDITSIPASLRLRIYYFDSYFLYLKDVTAQDILSKSTTVVIYDSATNGASDSVAFISGASPNLLFEVTILDAFGQRMGQTNDAYIYFLKELFEPFCRQGAFKLASSSSSNLVGMLGTTKFTFNNCNFLKTSLSYPPSCGTCFQSFQCERAL